MKKIKRATYLIIGMISLITGVIGIFLPLLPTTCFILFAAFCFSKSSDRLHSYLVNHPRFGESIQNWQQHGCMPLKAKIIATTMMLVSISYPIIFLQFHWGLKVGLVGTILAVLIYIWSRPSTTPKTQATIYPVVP